ncbi:MAG: heparinase II/III family protein [Kiritimatiellae bacterium]|nr:heparinase II/III family protein [Kiritimatiellia bacterium]
MSALQRLNRALMLGLVSVSVMSTAPAARAAAAARRSFAVQPGHPRLLFTAKELPVLKNRIGTTHALQWNSMKKWADGRMGRKRNWQALNRETATYAFLYQLSGEQKYADEAISMAKQAAEYVVAKGSGDLKKADTEIAHNGAMAYTYDCCYDHLIAADKVLLCKAMSLTAEWLIENPINKGWFFLGNHYANQVQAVGLIGLVMHGDHPKAAEFIDVALSKTTQVTIPMLRHLSGPGDGAFWEGWEYVRHEFKSVWPLFEAFRNALGEDLFAPEFQNFAYGLIYGTYPDNTMLRSGDNHFPAISRWERKYMSVIASEYRNPHAQWYIEHMPKVNEPITGAEAWYDILWYDPAVPQTPPDDLPLSRHFRGMGVVVARTGWYEPDAAVITFECGDHFGGHCHMDQNQFTIYRKGYLALDAGGYASWGCSHHVNYYNRTVAHNTITVFDPNEDLANNFNNNANDGGQIYLHHRNGADNKPRTVEHVRSDPQYQTGDMVVFEQGQGYVRALGDATGAYSAKKLKKFTREFVVLYPKIKANPPVVVVFDRVRATRPEYAKKWLLHTEHEPEQVAPGTWRATEGDGTLYVSMLEPQGAKAALVGGPGREFEVNGKNYPPPQKKRPKTPPNYLGNWRIEVQPPTPAERDLFLNVLVPVDKGEGSIPTVTRMETDNMLGGFIKGERGEPNTVVAFAKNKDALDAGDSISYRLPENGETRHLIADLPANVEYEIRLDGRLLQTRRTQDTRTETAVRKNLAPSSSFSFTTPAGAGGTVAIAPAS